MSDIQKQIETMYSSGMARDEIAAALGIEPSDVPEPPPPVAPPADPQPTRKPRDVCATIPAGITHAADVIGIAARPRQSASKALDGCGREAYQAQRKARLAAEASRRGGGRGGYGVG